MKRSSEESQARLSAIAVADGRRSPTISHTARIAELLGYDPFPEGTTLAERLVNYRKARGLRLKDCLKT